MKNIYYFKVICEIGGIETFFRNLAEKYKDWDITFYYESADKKQLDIIRQYCRCIQFNPANFKNGEKIKCDRAFFNFNLDMLPYVDAKEKILVVHGNYKLMNIIPPQDSRIDRVIAVSKDSGDAYTELTGIPCEICYNPLIYKKPEKLLKLICACRLSDPIKGGDRLRAFVKALDEYCIEHDKKYMLTLLTNGGTVKSPNVVMMQPRLDITPFMQDADYLLQFSDAEGFCYSVVEMLYLCNKPVIVTPCPVYKELGIDDTMSIRLNFDLSNMQEVFDKMFNTKWDFKYEIPKDTWDKVLVKGKSTYEIKYVTIQVLVRYNDLELGRVVNVGERLTVIDYRADYLISRGLVKLIEEEKDYDYN